MDYIVLDLEWNQGDNSRLRCPSGLIFEIIEIGAIKLNDRREQTDSFHELIKPQVFDHINQITGEIVHLSMKELESCRSFQETAADFLRWCGDDYIFCTWGDVDLLELQRNMDFYGMPPLSQNCIPYYDVQKLFGIAFGDRKKRNTLHYAVEFLKIGQEVPFHRADADAFYTVEVLKRLPPEAFQNYSFDTYRLPKTKAEEIHFVSDSHFKYISREFLNRNAARNDKDVVSTKCFLCGVKTKKRVPWFSRNGRNYYAALFCPQHGYIRGKIQIKKTADDKAYVIKSMKLIGIETVEEIIAKRNRIREERREKRRKER